MNRREMNAALLAGAALAAMPAGALAQEVRMLPNPRKEAGSPLMQALQLRRSTRQFSPRPLPPQVLSDLLWAAYGVNRPSGDRTAPYWRHIMVIDVYAAMADGVWLYDPTQHTLRPHFETDIRALTGLQDFVATAPLNLVYVAHGDRMKDISPEERRLYSSVDAAFAGQNVYLFCA
jgi:nitroreductase